MASPSLRCKKLNKKTAVNQHIRVKVNCNKVSIKKELALNIAKAREELLLSRFNTFVYATPCHAQRPHEVIGYWLNYVVLLALQILGTLSI